MVRAGAAAPTHRSAMRRISRRISMADNKTRGRTTDRKRLNMSEPYEVAYAKSDRASPERKAMLAKGVAKRAGSSAGNGAGAKRSAKTAAKKASGARKSSSAATRKSTASRSGKSSASGARKSSSARGSAGSASPAMKRTNAAPAKPRTPSKRGTPHPPTAEKTVENTAPKTMREPDAVDLLTDDHLAVAALFQRYERLSRR